jgi:hypothetical protein
LLAMTTFQSTKKGSDEVLGQSVCVPRDAG